MTSRLALFALTAILTSIVLAGCDGNESRSECKVLSEDTYAGSVTFLDRLSGASVAEFELQQTIRTYETGDCEAPSAANGGVRLIVKNLTMCELDIDYSLSVLAGRDGWTVEGSVNIAPGAARDVGIIHAAVVPRVDLSQKILTGSSVRSGCI